LIIRLLYSGACNCPIDSDLIATRSFLSAKNLTQNH
jgi:hypothetical protein